MSATVNGGLVPLRTEEVDQVVTVLRAQVIAICAQATRAPSLVRVSTRDIMVEVEWAGVEPVTALDEPVATGGKDAAAAAAPASEGTFPLCAGTVGVFYRAPEPGAQPFVAEGDTVRPGQQVAILEVMKLMTPVEAERAGRVVRFLVDDGTPVEHGQPVLLLEPAA